MHQTYDDFLVEIGTEELPPKSLHSLAQHFVENIVLELKKMELAYDDIHYFATPRRLAVLVKALANQQADRLVEKIGPSESIAYADGKPTAAALGFAKSCQIPFTDLTIKATPKGNCLYFSKMVPGEAFINLAPSLVKKALSELPIPKPMLWGSHASAFIRPVHWLVMLYGNNVIPCQLFDLAAERYTYGHRFHHPSPIIIQHPNDFETSLRQAYVIACYNERKESIRNQVLVKAEEKGKALIDEDLLNEVTGLVEWPVALVGSFHSRFLEVPPEALISAMKTHQKCFPVVDNSGNLLNYFIFIANIQSSEPGEVVIGNERVIRARLADAEFFYHTDQKKGLNHYLEQLSKVLFQTELGTLFDKANRIAKLAGRIATLMQTNSELAFRAGLLSKADLTTEMVGEFPELQGIMGYYYALDQHEQPEVAIAIKEHYQPRFAGDQLPATLLGCAVALADKLDTLVGIFGINQTPTGDKDPFALKRAALGVLRIIIEQQLTLDLEQCLHDAKASYGTLKNENVIVETLAFIMERSKAWYLEQGILPDVYAAVVARFPTAPYDFDQRIRAVQYFKQLPEAEALAGANKRVSNILKQTLLPPHANYNYALFELEAEKRLADIIEREAQRIQDRCRHFDYQGALTLLATFREPVDHFFDEVMVMVDDEKLRQNRLLLLNNLRQLFLQIADISLLQP